MIVEDIHVNPLCSAMCESLPIILLVDELANSGKNHCTREYGLKIASGHLQDKTK